MNAIPIIDTIAVHAAASDAWLVDVWGVMHDGKRPFAEAVAACQRFRAAGGTVLLLSNSPRPSSGVARQLDGLGVARDSYDAILSSGDMTRLALQARGPTRVHHIGPKRDLPTFEGLAVSLVPVAEAEIAVCTGLADDETETPETYRATLEALRARALPMICANPDRQVDRGGRMIPCAGAVAALYADMGGHVDWFGKPYPAVYARARDMLAELRGADVPLGRLLAIGDGADTDIKGACDAGIPAVYIASAVSLGKGVAMTPASLAALFAPRAHRPAAAMTRLRW